MIVDQIANAKRYYALHPKFAAGFGFLLQRDIAEMPQGRHIIEGDNVFAIVSRDEGRGKEHSPLEAHHRYIDIQFVVDGDERIGWLPTSHCQRISTPRDEDNDIAFYFDRPQTWVAVSNGGFAILYPDDAHAPLAGIGMVHKVVVKVAV